MAWSLLGAADISPQDIEGFIPDSVLDNRIDPSDGCDRFLGWLEIHKTRFASRQIPLRLISAVEWAPGRHSVCVSCIMDPVPLTASDKRPGFISSISARH